MGRFYCTLSFALLPAGLAVLFYMGSQFEEHGSQSAGAGFFALVLLAILAALTFNAFVAGLIAWRVKTCRPRLLQVGGLALGLVIAGIGVQLLAA